MKQNKWQLLGLLLIVGASNIYGASDPVKDFLDNINTWVFVTIGPQLILVFVGLASFTNIFSEEKGARFFKRVIISGTILTFATPLWAWYTGMFN